MGQEEEDESRDELVAPLRRLQRWACGTAGILAAAAGAWAALFGKNQAGSVAMLVFGALFLVMAITGRPIVWAKGGGFELKYGRLAKAVAKAVEESPPEVSQQLTEALLGEKGPTNIPSDAIFRKLDAIAYERNVIAALERVKPEDAELLIESNVGDRAFDCALIRGPQKVLVQIKGHTRVVPASVIYALLGAAGTAGGSTVLFITRTPLTMNAIAALTRSSLVVRAVEWREPADDALLKEEVQRLLV